MRRIVMVVFLISLAAMTVSCRPVKEIHTEHVIDSIYLHDTTTEYVHDTTKIVSVKVDSVEKYVETIIYTDSNGVVHEKEINKLTHFIYLQDEELRVTKAYYEREIKKLKTQLENKSDKTTEYIEKPLKLWQKTLMFFGAMFFLGLWFAIYHYKIKKK